MTNGTCNGGDRGNVEDRRRRRAWLVQTYRSDVDLLRVRMSQIPYGVPVLGYEERGSVGFIVPRGLGEPTCRCYRCGCLLVVDDVSPDRIIPGAQGGTYRRNNIRPACLLCQCRTGHEMRYPPPALRKVNP